MKKNIFAINGSAGSNTANSRLLQKLTGLTGKNFQWELFDDLKKLPHFDPQLSIEHTPSVIVQMRAKIEQADAVLMATPEYVFSIPSGLKNLIEWCVSTTVFSDKPVCLITASAHGAKGHEALQLIMKTVGAHFTPETTLLLQGVKAKFPEDESVDVQTEEQLEKLMAAFCNLIQNHPAEIAAVEE